MSPRARRTLGMFSILIGLVIYCLLVMRLAVWILPIHWIVDLVFYVVAGIIWIFPAYWIMKRTSQ